MNVTRCPRFVVYPVEYNTIAFIIGFLRSESNKKLKDEHKEYDRGDINNDVDALGVLGELLAGFVCFNNRIDYQMAPLLSDSPKPEPDIIFNGKRLDAKMTRDDLTYLAVNENAHNKIEKGITHYWFFQKTAINTARHWIYTYEQVSEWDVRQLAYSPAYCLDIDK